MRTKALLMMIAVCLLSACDSYGPDSGNPTSVIIDSIKYTYYLKDATSNYATSFSKESYLSICLDIENLSSKNLQVANNRKLGDCYQSSSKKRVEQLSMEPAEPDTVKSLFVQLLPAAIVRKKRTHHLSSIPSGKYYYQAPTETIIDGRDTIIHKIPLSIKFEIK